MILSKQILKNSMKGLKISGIVGLSTLLIMGGFIHSNLYATTITPTTSNVTELTTALSRQVPAGYVKSSYKFTVASNSQPTAANELSPTDATEIMSQELYRYLRLDLSGKTIKITHDTSKHDSKLTWRGSIEINATDFISIDIDSVTGELNMISSHILLPFKPGKPKAEESSVEDFDPVITKNLKANCKKVQDLITTTGCLPEKIKSVAYSHCMAGTCYGGEIGHEKPIGDNISYQFNVTTESGKVYEFMLPENLSRIDGVSTPAYIAHSNEVLATYRKQQGISK